MADERRRTAARHTVLASTDGAAFASLRQPTLPRVERYALGRKLRQQVTAHDTGRLGPRTAGAPTPSQSVIASNEGRVDRLIPVRIGRMVASPFSFLRGAAAIMAADFSPLPATGITPVICGDAHLGNFGFYASPERDLVFDLNDFDEAHPGAWEWDLRRLVASVHVAGRQNGASEDECGDAVRRCVRSYREHLAHLAEQPLLARAYDRLNLDRLHRDRRRRRRPAGDRERRGARPQAHQRPRAPPVHRAARRRAAPRRGAAADHPAGPGAVRAHRRSPSTTTCRPLRSQWAVVLGGYRLVDVAHKVVGVGSVGLRAYIALCEGSRPGRRAVPAAQAGAAVGRRAVRARRLGVARPPGPAGRAVPAGAADGQRPAARLDHGRRARSTTCASSAT